MKNIFTLLLILTFSFSQAQNKKLERVKALRVAFLSNKLELTPEEAERFWPIYNQFESKQTELRFQKKMMMFKLQPENSSNISEKELNKMLTDSENIENDIQNNRKKFVKDLQGVIPTQKILMLKQLEEEFKKTLLNQFKNRMKNEN
jgi:hypothetical protein